MFPFLVSCFLQSLVVFQSKQHDFTPKGSSERGIPGYITEIQVGEVVELNVYYFFLLNTHRSWCFSMVFRDWHQKVFQGAKPWTHPLKWPTIVRGERWRKHINSPPWSSMGSPVFSILVQLEVPLNQAGERCARVDCCKIFDDIQ